MPFSLSRGLPVDAGSQLSVLRLTVTRHGFPVIDFSSIAFAFLLRFPLPPLHRRFPIPAFLLSLLSHKLSSDLNVHLDISLVSAFDMLAPSCVSYIPALHMPPSSAVDAL